jgi:hypothetical protein
MCSTNAAGTPVLIGKVQQQDMRNFAAMSSVINWSTTTRLFRFNYKSTWRIVGARDVRPIAQSVRQICAEINLDASDFL